ncbi:amidohydrolase family protein [Arcicella rosea]|uniref:Imidazolonepropionase-like amidohydrolase n=1 Tax=Arcicella rosea TaxID=502909 RepID=A0A841END8_9BACT|nr:amidohydrolase family protein [Arcicella rosea]MBB6002248.1 imidazolonepropionase-like amidohydrolase [Arcicella rosea]
MKVSLLKLSLLLFFNVPIFAQQGIYLLKPARIFDGESIHENWQVLVQKEKNIAVGENLKIPQNTEIINLPNTTLLPGLIEGHSHLLLHPYNETTWDDQVLKESRAERIVRATVHAKNTLMAGFTTVRDLGTEGADYDDIGLKQSIEKGIIPGPRMLVAGRALVVTGSYGPKGFQSDVTVVQGAEEADGTDNLSKAVRTQIGKGVDVIKVYADYRWGLFKDAQPTFLASELKLVVDIAKSSGRDVVAHASTEEGMRRAIMAGVKTIEHGDGATAEIFKLMKEKDVCFCPTLAAGDATSQYKGWKKGQEPEPERIQLKRKSFKEALASGVKICMGGDVGVFPHGENAREMEMMVEYGMKAINVLQSSTSVNAEVFKLKDLGNIKAGYLADIIAVQGEPEKQISTLKNVIFVMKNGIIYKK